MRSGARSALAAKRRVNRCLRHEDCLLARATRLSLLSLLSLRSLLCVLTLLSLLSVLTAVSAALLQS